MYGSNHSVTKLSFAAPGTRNSRRQIEESKKSEEFGEVGEDEGFHANSVVPT